MLLKRTCSGLINSSPRANVTTPPYLTSSATTSKCASPAANMNHAAPPTSWASLDHKSLSLIRRTLCPHHPPTTPLSDLLPALTSSPCVDAHLYVLLSIIIRDFVLVWYSHISTEPSFIEEIVSVIAHCTRAIEERARKVDWETLVFDDLPAVLEAHITGTSTPSPFPVVSKRLQISELRELEQGPHSRPP